MTLRTFSYMIVTCLLIAILAVYGVSQTVYNSPAFPNGVFLAGVNTSAIAKGLIGINSSNKVSIDPDALGSVASGTFNQLVGNQFNGVTSLVRTTANFTTSGSGTNFEPITGLSWVLPANTAENVAYGCTVSYSVATSGATASFGLNFTQAPTNALVSGIVQTNTTAFAGGASVISTATSAGITGTTGATATNFYVSFGGVIENPSQAANTVTVNAKTGTAADIITVLRGSYCSLSY